MEVNSDRLYMRKLQLSDAEGLFNYRSNKSVNQFQSWIPETIDEVIDFISNKIADEINLPDTWFQYAILLKSNNQLIGDLGIHFMEDNQQIEIGCTLNIEHQGNGYATEALHTIIDLMFSTYNKHRVFASVDPRNTKSIQLIENLGFRKEAHFKESYLHQGKWVDDIVYALRYRECKRID